MPSLASVVIAFGDRQLRSSTPNACLFLQNTAKQQLTGQLDKLASSVLVIEPSTKAGGVGIRCSKARSIRLRAQPCTQVSYPKPHYPRFAVRTARCAYEGHKRSVGTK